MLDNTTLIRQKDAEVTAFVATLGNKARERFRFWHVETLLNRSADLLDRALGDSNHLSELNAKASLFDLDTASLEDAASVERTRRDTNSSITRVLTNLLAQQAALDTLAPHHQNIIDNLGNARTNLFDNALAQADADLNEAQIAQMRWDLERSILDQNIAWQTVDAPLQLEASRALDRILSRRAIARMDGKALDYASQAVPVSNRLQRDFAEACEMLLIASEGLGIIYGYDDAFPDIREGDAGFAAVEDLDAVVYWNRQAIRWLSAFSQLDQAITVSVALKSVLGGLQQWVAFVAGEKVSFAIDPSYFKELAYVRFRGATAGLVCSKQHLYPISLALQLPIKASNRHAHSTVEVDQRRLPICYLGRVVDLTLPSASEVYGQVALMNASPCGTIGAGAQGQFSIQLRTPSTVELVDDVVLDLRLAARTALS